MTTKYIDKLDQVILHLHIADLREAAITELREMARLADAYTVEAAVVRQNRDGVLDKWRTPLTRDDLEFDNGTLVKIRGARLTYMSGWRLIDTARNLAALLAPPKPVSPDENIGSTTP